MSVDIGVFWTSQDAQAVREILATAFHAEKKAATKLDQRLLRKINQLVVGVVELCELRQALSQSSGQIQGIGGADQLIGLSRNGIYKRVESLGLSISDVRAPNTRVASLVQKSSVLGPIARDLQINPARAPQASPPAKPR